MTRKSDGSVKARLVVRGFEELEYLQSDSPTASNNSLKLFFALAANENKVDGCNKRIFAR